MSELLQSMDNKVAELSAPGAPFELNEVTVHGVNYRNYATMPANLGEYYKFMLVHADKDFAVYQDERYTFAQGYQHGMEFGAALLDRFGVQKGERVAILARNSPQWLTAFIGATTAGTVAVPMNSWWTTEELDYGFADSGATVVVADRARCRSLLPLVEKFGLKIIAVDDCTDLGVEHTPFGSLLADYAGAEMPEVDVAPDDHATIMYTSGSTGHPKGALSSHRGILSALYSWMLMGTADKLVTPDSTKADGGVRYPATALLTVPLFHCTGSHSAFLLSLIVGRKLVIMYKWDVEEALRLIEQERVTYFNGVPTMSAELQAAALTSDRDVSSLQDIFSGGAARPPEQVDKLAGTFKKSSPAIGYGLTETNALGAANSGVLYIANPTSTGRAVPAVTDFRIIDDNGDTLPAGERGELCIKSPANVLGYWNKPEATAEAFVDGWFRTGDVGYLDDDGFLYIVDRIKDIIIRGGENISCIEVEAAIYTHPAVEEVAVFGLPDERLGEIVGATVVLRENAALTADELRAALVDHLAAFKIPAHIWLGTDKLPRIASGKIFKRELKTTYTATLQASAANE
ncbi:MAG: class I adenylate-forming enzyme family protein [Halioglobus sp.]